ncbi:dTDP-glucose 4,6-dehydratase [Rhodopirellula sallentina]|uniref:dTDP-glucose 4,6-dehydratase n=1 Tax=Rhodopirellula sallentina SM41 TaxID=1263870 RepID=M5U8I5_9BACT|nr:dTDP-glucose 4,6-dehydratase [Rhodopirellula sallentina]EMI52268.1 dTDP-glucose 4,6-dehydratase [Rhodopirellula sallentina SM41]
MALKTILITGGAGFIGSCHVRMLLSQGDVKVVNLDNLTYAGNLDSLPSNDKNHVFVQGDIGDSELVRGLLAKHKPEAVINFAAESHVDRSIDGPIAFVETNVLSTVRLLKEVTEHWDTLTAPAKDGFRFLHVSTDEVYGSLGEQGMFTETTSYSPRSPYSASKAASDHFINAWHHTYGLPILLTNCSNNYGPYQFPEKLIPLMILNALDGKKLPLYGDGLNVRDWLFVQDHCEAISVVLEKGIVGECYNIGGNTEKTNREIVQTICSIVDSISPLANGQSHESLIEFVKDRPGHDRRYAVDTTKIRTELGWHPRFQFADAIHDTVTWYVENPQWVGRVQSGEYQQQRLGLGS